jgi:uncharacterized membrane protein
MKPHRERGEKFQAYVDSLPEFKINLRKWSFWRSAFIFFIFFSLLGHLLEFFWWWGLNLESIWNLHPIPIIAEPYGFGALVVLLLVYPLVKRRKIDVVGTFVLGALLTTVVEFICALMTVLVHGYNPYWDYSNNFLNLFGFVCLQNSLAFGFVSLAFVYFLFPWLDHQMSKISEKVLNIVAISLGICYAISLTSQFLWMGRIIL